MTTRTLPIPPLLPFISASLLALPAPSLQGDWSDSKAAASVLGQAGFDEGQINRGEPGPTASSLNLPGGMARDPLTGKLFVCDTENNRILRFGSAAALATGAAAEAVFGQDEFTSGGGGGASANLDLPDGIHLDGAGRLWVADSSHHRVLMYENASGKPSGAAPDGLLGSATFDSAPMGSAANQMAQPRDVAMDASGRLWVADWANHRVLRFDGAVAKALANAADPLVNTAMADGVLGQNDFGLTDSNQGLDDATAASMDRPWKLEVDPAGNLWVSDTRNDRLLYFIDPETKANGGSADGLLGTASFSAEPESGVGPDRFSRPLGLAFDVTGALWLADHYHHRVLRFDTPAADALANAADPLLNTTLPDGILGQTGYTASFQSIAADGLVAPTDVAVSPYGDLWVVQSNNTVGGNRVSRFRADPNSWRGDVLVGLTATTKRGDNLYNLTGAGQFVTRTSRKQRLLRFHLAVHNDGVYFDDLLLKGVRGTKNFRVSYFRTSGGRTNVTSAVVVAGLRENAIAPRATLSYLVEVKPKRTTKGKRRSQLLRFTATSLYGGGSDQVRARAKTRR